MANYYGTVRTNYFRVTDEEKYKKLFENLCSEDDIHDFSETSEDGTILHGFGSYATIDYPIEEDEYDLDEFIRQLQTILPNDEAFMLFEAGHEKLCYVGGYCTVATNKEVYYMSLDTWAKDKAKELLGDDFETQTMY